MNWKDSTYADQWDSAAALTGTNKLEFIRGASDNVVFTFDGLRLATAFPSTDFEAVTNSDLVNSSLKFTSLIATDSIATY